MDNQIELNKFYLIYDNDAIIIYPIEYYGKYGNRIRFNIKILFKLLNSNQKEILYVVVLID